VRSARIGPPTWICSIHDHGIAGTEQVATMRMLIAFATWPGQPTYWRFTPAVCSPFFACPVSSKTATASGPPQVPGPRSRERCPSLRVRPTRRGPSSRCISSGV